jgi:uncharacterized YccA/Bax inhibitor family protein
MFRTANPTLTDAVFTREAQASSSLHLDSAERMTIHGVVHRTLGLVVLTTIAALFTWNRRATPPWIFGGVIVGGITALVISFKPRAAPIGAPIYALAQGLFLGAVSSLFEQRWPGIVIEAVALTLGTLGALLVAYRFGLIQATENFKAMVVAGTVGLGLVYLVAFVLRLCGVDFPLLHSTGPWGILFGLLVVALAAMNLVLDFDFIERGAGAPTPKYMEWYASFALLVTLLWLYVEFLRLLARARSRK